MFPPLQSTSRDYAFIRLLPQVIPVCFLVMLHAPAAPEDDEDDSLSSINGDEKVLLRSAFW